MNSQKIKTISEYYGLDKKILKDKGVLDRFIWIDTELFVDPFLIDTTSIPEFEGAKEKIGNRFNEVIKLLSLSNAEGDMPFKAASKKLECPETKGIWIWYSQWNDDWNSIWPVLAKKIAKTWKEVINLWFDDPEIFELLGLFQENFWEDRLSDLCIHTLTTEFFMYTERITKEIGIKSTKEVLLNGKKFLLPCIKEENKYILFVPKKVLRDTPTGLNHSNIEHVATFNNTLKDNLNHLVWKEWREYLRNKWNRKREFFNNPESIEDLLKYYNWRAKIHYDFEKDPKWEMNWKENWLRIVAENPATLTLCSSPSMEDVKIVIREIIQQFKESVEHNGANELIIKWNEHFSERYAQKVFFTVASSYCKTNNLDISPESKASTWPVDFKFSHWTKKVVVEMKLTSGNIQAWVRQLEEYEKWENAEWIYLIIQVKENKTKIKNFFAFEKLMKEEGNYFPEYYFVDSRIKPTPSNL